MAPDLFDSLLGQPLSDASASDAPVSSAPDAMYNPDLFDISEDLSQAKRHKKPRYDKLSDEPVHENLREPDGSEGLRCQDHDQAQNKNTFQDKLQDKFFEILLHQMPKRLQEGLAKILLPNADPQNVAADASSHSFGVCANTAYRAAGAEKTRDSEAASLLAPTSLLAPAAQQGKASIYREAWRDDWYAYCAVQAQSSANSCWKLLKDFALSYYVQERYFQDCYRQSSLCLEREQRGEFFILLRGDSRYPLSLLELHHAPRILFWRGRLLPQDAASTAIIGTRRAGSWGLHQAWQVALLLQKEKDRAAPDIWHKAAREHWILSGLAHGCDYGAHRGALDAAGPTLALLPGGFDRIYPKQHQGLAQEIVDSGGALASEYIPSAEPMKWRFIQRDRLQSAMAQRVLLVESPLDGGSMHTVRAALQLGKPVFTLAGTEACWQITAAEAPAPKGASAANAEANLKGRVRLQKVAELLKNLGSLQVGENGPQGGPQIPALLEANHALLREELAQLWNLH